MGNKRLFMFTDVRSSFHPFCTKFLLLSLQLIVSIIYYFIYLEFVPCDVAFTAVQYRQINPKTTVKKVKI